MMRITREDAFDVQPLHDGALDLGGRRAARQPRGACAARCRLARPTLADHAGQRAAARGLQKMGRRLRRASDRRFCLRGMGCASENADAGPRPHGPAPRILSQGDGFFAFATEIKGLWALPQVPRVLLEEASRAASAVRRSRRRSARPTYEGIHAIPGGTVLTLDAPTARSHAPLLGAARRSGA